MALPLAVASLRPPVMLLMVGCWILLDTFRYWQAKNVPHHYFAAVGSGHAAAMYSVTYVCCLRWRSMRPDWDSCNTWRDCCTWSFSHSTWHTEEKLLNPDLATASESPAEEELKLHNSSDAHGCCHYLSRTTG